MSSIPKRSLLAAAAALSLLAACGPATVSNHFDGKGNGTTTGKHLGNGSTSGTTDGSTTSSSTSSTGGSTSTSSTSSTSGATSTTTSTSSTSGATSSSSTSGATSSSTTSSSTSTTGATSASSTSTSSGGTSTGGTSGTSTSTSTSGTTSSTGTSGTTTSGSTSGTTTGGGTSGGGTTPWVEAYYVGWDSTLLPPSAIDYTAMTHVIAFALLPQSDGSVKDAYGLPSSLVTDAHAAGVKAIISIGTDFSQAINNKAALINNIVSYMQSHGYDGVDIDWENGYSATWASFLSDLRTRLDQISPRPILVTTATLSPKQQNATDTTAQILATGAPYVDMINLMTYDMSGNWSGWATWHSGPLTRAADQFPCCTSSTNPYYLPAIEDYVARMEAAGIPASKVGIGIGFVGQRWHGVTGPMQSVNGVTGLDWDVYYSTIMDSEYVAANDHWDNDAQVPYLSNTANNTFLSYENPQSVTLKGQYVKSAGLGGAILWHLSAGYRPNQPAGSRDVLLQAVKASMLQ